MLLTGHDTILLTALASLGYTSLSAFFEAQPLVRGIAPEGRRRHARQLAWETQSGLHIPDLPCIEYVYDEERGAMRIDKWSLCSLLRLNEMSNAQRHGLGSMYQSHRGRHCAAHSMALDYSVTVLEMRNHIVQRLVWMYELALIGEIDEFGGAPMPRFLGMVLHSIQDSYSPAHTVRSGWQPAPVRDRMPNVWTQPTPNIDREFALERDIVDLHVAYLLRNWLSHNYDAAVCVLQSGANDTDFVVHLLAQLWRRHTELRTRYFAQDYRVYLERYASTRRPVRMLAAFIKEHLFNDFHAERTRRHRALATRPCDATALASPPRPRRLIVDFQWIYDQECPSLSCKLAHPLTDRLNTVRKHSLFEAVVDDTCEVLVMYQRHMRGLTVQTLPSSLQEFEAYLVAGPYALDPRVSTQRCGHIDVRVQDM